MEELYIIIITQTVAIILGIMNMRRLTKEERDKIREEAKNIKLKNKLLELEIKEKEARRNK